MRVPPGAGHGSLSSGKKFFLEKHTFFGISLRKALVFQQIGDRDGTGNPCGSYENNRSMFMEKYF